jgi:hypothetical protein
MHPAPCTQYRRRFNRRDLLAAPPCGPTPTHCLPSSAFASQSSFPHSVSNLLLEASPAPTVARRHCWAEQCIAPPRSPRCASSPLPGTSSPRFSSPCRGCAHVHCRFRSISLPPDEARSWLAGRVLMPVQRDNVIVALKYDYTQEDIGWREREVNIACALILTCLGIQVRGHGCLGLIQLVGHQSGCCRLRSGASRACGRKRCGCRLFSSCNQPHAATARARFTRSMPPVPA